MKSHDILIAIVTAVVVLTAYFGNIFYEQIKNKRAERRRKKDNLQKYYEDL